MKIGGVVVTPSEAVLVLPRTNSQDIVFKAKAVSFTNDFNKLCPEPVAPLVTTKNGKHRDVSDADYKQAVNFRDERRFAYMCLRALEPSEIEWDEVDIEKPGTWTKWADELTKAGLSEVEVNRVVTLIMEAMALDEDKIKKARENFLLGQEA